VCTWQPATGNSRRPAWDASTSPTTASAASSAAALMRGLRAPELSAARAAPLVRVLQVEVARCLDAVARMSQARACPLVTPEVSSEGWCLLGVPPVWHMLWSPRPLHGRAPGAPAGAFRNSAAHGQQLHQRACFRQALRQHLPGAVALLRRLQSLERNALQHPAGSVERR